MRLAWTECKQGMSAMVDADSFVVPHGLRMERREVREHYNTSGMIIFRELVSISLCDDRMPARCYYFKWDNREMVKSV